MLKKYLEKQLLLISSSHIKDGEFFSHCFDTVKEFLGIFSKEEVVAFIPYALKDYDKYTDEVRKSFTKMGYKIISVHEVFNPINLITDINTRAVFIGGGNTFRLKKMLERNNLVDVIKTQVEAGKKYIGSSAGAILACPTIQTTNDMPIVVPQSLGAFNLVDFQINPHFISEKVRLNNIKRFLEENDTMVVGLPEDCWIIEKENDYVLGGTSDAVIFQKKERTSILWRIGEFLNKDNLL